MVIAGDAGEALNEADLSRLEAGLVKPVGKLGDRNSVRRTAHVRGRGDKVIAVIISTGISIDWCCIGGCYDAARGPQSTEFEPDCLGTTASGGQLQPSPRMKSLN